MKYFKKPTQVMFLDEDNEYKAGIAYRDEIICSCCGGIYEIDDLCENVDPTNPLPTIVPLEWIDFSDSIRWEGNELNDHNFTL